MRIILTQQGWQGYTGQFGAHEFKDGVSVEDLGTGDVRLLASITSVEEYVEGVGATGKNPSPAQMIIDHQAVRAPVVSHAAKEGEAAPDAAVPAKVYTAAELEEIADKTGIKGIREAAQPLGLNGKSIAELIGKILAKQDELAAKAKQAAEDAATDAAKAVKAVGGPIDPPAAA